MLEDGLGRDREVERLEGFIFNRMKNIVNELIFKV